MENKTARYFKYAIGEIILVVIGILIALQINNWNEDKKKRQLEKVIIASFNSEFKNNQIKLKESITRYENTEHAIRNLMSKMTFTSEELHKENIDSLIATAIDVFEYHPTQNTLTELLSTGSLNLISNESLKFQLLNWSGEIDELKEAWRTLDDFNQDLVLPYLSKNLSMRNIDVYSLMQWKELSPFEVNYESVFNDMEFENHLDNIGWAVVNYKNSLQRLDGLIHQIILFTND